MDLVNTIVDFFQAGFATVNQVQGLIIALVAAMLIPSWHRWPIFALAAAIVHVAVDTLLPVLASGAPFRLPDIVHFDFWRYVLTLIAGYFVVIGVLLLLRRVILRR